MASNKQQLEHELFEDSRQNGNGSRPARNSILRRPSSGAGLTRTNPKDPARRTLSRGYSASRGANASANKIEDLFDTHFTMETTDIARVLDAATNAANRGEPANCKEMNALKNALISIVGEVDTLKAKCVVIEERYKDATITASQELQQSMNILFQLQQKTANLQDSSSNVEKLSDELKMLKLRLASTDKERRTFKSEAEYKEKTIQEQAAQIKEMNSMLGGTSEELAQRSIDAKRANALWEDLRYRAYKQ
jgi:chromosome segregation ATPase